MQSDVLGSPAWWHEAGVKLPSRIRWVCPGAGLIKQKNSSVLPYTLKFVDGRHINIVVKVVDLRNNGYRDQEHRNRSLQSYKVETAFYHEFGDKLEKVEAKVPDLLHDQWQANDDGLTIVLEDLRCQPSATRLTNQALGLSFAQAVLALKWLAKMHAVCWGCAPTGIWPQGSYWSLEKRRSDLPGMSLQWSTTCLAFAEEFPQTFQKASVQALAQRLTARAEDIHQQLSVDSATAAPFRTIIHGDFKAANLFVSPTAEAASRSKGDNEAVDAASVSACDFQWCGGGLGATDVMYLLWTSVQPKVIQDREQDLLWYAVQRIHSAAKKRWVFTVSLTVGKQTACFVWFRCRYRDSRKLESCTGECMCRCYHSHLQYELQQQHGLNGHTYNFGLFCHHYQLAYLDYTRFLIAAMWGAVTPKSCEAFAQEMCFAS